MQACLYVSGDLRSQWGCCLKNVEKTVLPGGIRHCAPEDLNYTDTNIYGAILKRSPVFEGDYGVRSAYVRMKRGDVIKSHRHRKWVQVMVVSGELHVVQGDQDFRAKPGEVYFLDPGHEHVETAVDDTLVLVTQGEDRAGWE